MPYRPKNPAAPDGARHRQRLAAFALTAILAGAGLTGLAVAKSSHPTLNSAHNAKLHATILVDSRGVTLYTLSGETAHHLKCTPQAQPKGMCLKFWPPLTVHSAKSKITAAKGIKGKLGIIHRNGFFQVTLGGRPLYAFMLDHGKKGSTVGEGIATFGGTWHVVKLSSTTKSTSSSAPQSTVPAPTTPMNPY